MPHRRSLAVLLALAAAAAGGFEPAPVRAQPAFPERPIRLVVPFAPGGVYDAIARPLAETLRAPLGQVVIENVGGAGGVRGASMVARAEKDGYTLLLGGSSMLVVAPLAQRKPAYDPEQDFAAIYRLAVVGLSIVAGPAVAARSLKELAAHANANPGKLSFGTPGAGTTNHLAGEMFKSVAGAPGIAHVPYSGAGPALNDLVGGHIPLAVVNVTGSVLDLARSGKLRVIAVMMPGRHPGLPEVPTAIEAGYQALEAQIFAGLFAPRGTPQPILERIAAATSKAMADPVLRDIYTKAGFDPDPGSGPAAMQAFLRSEIVRWKPVIEATGLKID